MLGLDILPKKDVHTPNTSGLVRGPRFCGLTRVVPIIGFQAHCNTPLPRQITVQSPDRQSASLPTPTTDSRLDHRFSTTPKKTKKIGNSGPNGSNESTSKLSLVLGALVETAMLLDYNEQDGRPVLITTSARTHGVPSPHYCTREFIGLWVTHSGYSHRVPPPPPL